MADFKLVVPLDASGIKDFKPGQPVKVTTRDSKGNVSEQVARFDASGKGTAEFTFPSNPGALRITVGPGEASAEELHGLQNALTADVLASQWNAGSQLTIPALRITPQYWAWWLRFCQEFTIRGRVLCADGSPVPGATVCAYDVDWWWWWISEDLVGCATTDANGAFEISFRWCCGWWPWWWWAQRYWSVEPLLVEKIRPAIANVRSAGTLPAPSPQPDLSIFRSLVADTTPPRPGPLTPTNPPRVLTLTGSAVSTSTANLGAALGLNAPAAVDPAQIAGLGQQLLTKLPASSELARLRVWPWYPWTPWWDCNPDIIFKVTQNCKGQSVVIVNETVFDAREDIPTTFDVTLQASSEACCVRPCGDTAPCPEGECIVISDVCLDLIATIGGNPGASPAPATIGYLNPGVVSDYGDRPYAGIVSLSRTNIKVPAGMDYYEFEWSTTGAPGSYNPMPPAAAGGFTRWYWGPKLGGGPVDWYPVSFNFSMISGRNVIQSREHFEANNDPLSWGVTRSWDAATENLLMEWLTENTFADGTYYLRIKSYTLSAGNLIKPIVLPLCDTKNDNGVVLTLDNRYVSPTEAASSSTKPCGPGTVHLCTTEPDCSIFGVRINGSPVSACAIFNAHDGGKLEIDFMAHDPDGHLSYYTLFATYDVNLAVNLLTAPGATLTPGPPLGAIPPAAQVGPNYGTPSTPFGTALGQGAVSPKWPGGTYTLTIPDLRKAFPESCCYQLQLWAYKRTVYNCDHGLDSHDNLAEYSFTVAL